MSFMWIGRFLGTGVVLMDGDGADISNLEAEGNGDEVVFVKPVAFSSMLSIARGGRLASSIFTQTDPVSDDTSAGVTGEGRGDEKSVEGCGQGGPLSTVFKLSSGYFWPTPLSELLTGVWSNKLGSSPPWTRKARPPPGRRVGTSVRPVACCEVDGVASAVVEVASDTREGGGS